MLGRIARLFAPAPSVSPSAMSAARAKVDDLVKKHKVVIFSKTYCPYCTKGKRAMAQFVDVPSADVFLWELDQGTDAAECAAVQDALLDATGGRSVPRVFVGGKFVGGGDDTAAKASSGELLRLLKAAGVPTKA